MQNLSFYAPTGAYTFITKTLPCFTEIAIAFYPLNSVRKILPEGNSRFTRFTS